MRRAVGLGALVAAGAAGLALFRSRRRVAAERVDLHFADGSTISLSDGAGDAERLLARARDVLDAAR